jgi:hypothetical protein
MKRTPLLSLALIVGLCLQAPLAFAEDQEQNKNDTKEAKGSPHTSKAKAEAGQQVQKGAGKGVTSREDQSQREASVGNSSAAHRSKNTGAQYNETAGQNALQSNQRQSQGRQTPAFAVRGNRSNQYNGQWVAGDTHSDWDRNGDHHWGNHDYRWYDGGWLIIDVGDYESGSIVSRVKESLAQQGYYNGHISDRIGPHTRAAIASYQTDNGLPVNGRIDEPLLVSLRLE